MARTEEEEPNIKNLKKGHSLLNNINNYFNI